MQRLITFGCSFTDYAWPTWADIIALDRGMKFENWAVGGGGNQQIARRALYRWARGLEATDLVMIAWTSITREDRFMGGRWRAEGSVFSSPTYKDRFAPYFWDWENDVINTVQARITTERLLSPWLKFQHGMTWRDSDSDPELDTPLTKFWLEKLKPLPEFPHSVVTWNGRTGDGHPDPQWWLNWVENEIYPRLGWELKTSTREQVLELQHWMNQRVNEGVTHRELQNRTHSYAQSQGWLLRPYRVGSDPVDLNQGSDILM